MESLRNRLAKVFWWVKPAYTLFGFWHGLFTLVAAVAVALWTKLSGLPWPVIFAVTYVTVIGTVFLLMIPAMFRLLARGNTAAKANFGAYRKVQQLKIFQAACLLAGVSPAQPYPTGEAMDWAIALEDAVASGEVERIPDEWEKTGAVRFRPRRASKDTIVSRASLMAFCKARKLTPEFLGE